MTTNILVTWFEELIYGFANAGVWLSKTIVRFNGVSYTPLYLLTFVGLVAFITIAVAKWLVV